MELVKDVVVDFCLFSLIEGFIFCLFFEKIGGCKKFKWYEVLILSIGNCIISTLLPPLMFQLIGLLYMTLYINIRDKFNLIKSFKISLFSSIYILILEMLYSMIFLILFKNDLFFINDIYLFLLILPMKILEISLIKIIKNGGIVL